MARYRQSLLVLLAIVAAIGVITATGAFSTVTAERTATVNVRGDASALLGLTPCNGPNGWNGGTAGSSNGYADIKDGVLVVNLGGFDGGTPEGQGLNPDARTTFDCVFNLTNNGRSAADIEVGRDGPHPGFVTFWRPGIGDTNVTSPFTFELTPGETATISIEVDLTGEDFSGELDAGDALIDTIEITATTGGSGGNGGSDGGAGGGSGDDENSDEDQGDDGNSDGDSDDDDDDEDSDE